MLELFGGSLSLVCIGIGLLFVLSIILWVLRKLLHWVIIPLGIFLGGFYLVAVLVIIFLSKFKIWVYS
jgi:hypothetical protein